MQEEFVWSEVVRLIASNDSPIDYYKINALLKNDPYLAVAYMEPLFSNVSFNRMKQLAKKSNKEEIDATLFEPATLEQAWRLMLEHYSISPIEYGRATAYSRLRKKKYSNGTTENDARQILNHLLYIAERWLENNTQPWDQRMEDNIHPMSQQKGNGPQPADQGLDDRPYSMDQQQEDYPQPLVHPSMGLGESESAATIKEDSLESAIDQNAAASPNESQFVAKLQVLQSSSKESVANADFFGALRNYMHVERGIQKELESILINVRQQKTPNLILLCGSVGDGKSHLLAYIKENRPELVEGVFIHNDSTESYDPDKNSLETLERVLETFNEGEVPERNVIIAINLGVLHNFYSQQRKTGKFQALCKFIENSGVFAKGKDAIHHDGQFHLLNFAEVQPYVLTKDGPESPFFLELINKVTHLDLANPFYVAWLKDRESGVTSAAHFNYFLMQQKEVKETIVLSLIEVMIKRKVFISTRTFYNFLFDIIVPVNNQLLSDDAAITVKDLLPNLLYGHPDRSPLLANLNEIDPLKRRLESTDALVTNFMLKADTYQYVKEVLGEKLCLGPWKQLQNMHQQGKRIEFSKTLIRHQALLQRNNDDYSYQEFVDYLFSFYMGDEDEMGKIFELIEKVIYAWKGSPKERYIYADSPNKTFRIAYEINIEPEIDEKLFGTCSESDEVERFTPSLRLGYRQGGQPFLFELDYKLYTLLKQISEGYRPNRQDIQDALQFSEFHDKIIKSANKQNNVLLVSQHDGAILEVKKPRFSKAKFEVGKVK